METNEAVSTLAALAQSTRLAAFRYLVKAGPGGAPAGEVAEALDVAPATLSFHLKELEHAGLVISRREGRRIFYSAGYGAMRGLMDYLTEDCCQGHPEICQPLAQRAQEEDAA
jgi:DNA-binding transcriptional ArsR family regulator